MLGSPGAGKSMLARRLATILPDLALAEASETTRIHSVAGLTEGRTALVTARPFRAPHQTISDVGLIGGGHVPMPGEVSRAHHGVRCVDERPECRRPVLEVLRQPLEEGSLEAPLRGRPESRCVGGLRRTHDGCRGSRESPVAAHHRGSPHARAVTTSPLLPLEPAPAFRLTPGRVWSTDTPFNPRRSGTGAGLLPRRPLRLARPCRRAPACAARAVALRIPRA
jgi:hypothetical protein